MVIDCLVENLLKYRGPELFIAKSELLKINNFRGVSTNYVSVLSTYVTGTCKEYLFGCFNHCKNWLWSLFCWWNISKIVWKIVFQKYVYFQKNVFVLKRCTCSVVVISFMSWDICIKLGFKQYAPYFVFISWCDPSKLFLQLKQVLLTLGNVTLRCARPAVLKWLKTKKQLLHFSLSMS